MVSSFQWASKQGVLCEENMRGMRFNVTDCELHTDAIHRGGGQIMPTARRLYYALQIAAQPTLLEPIFSCDITAPSDCMGGVYQSLNQRRGQVVEEIQISGTPLNLVPFYLFRLKLISLSLNLSVSPVCWEETLKEKLSLSAFSTIGRPLRDFLLLTKKLQSWSWASEREKDSRKNSLFWRTIWTKCDVNKILSLLNTNLYERLLLKILLL